MSIWEDVRCDECAAGLLQLELAQTATAVDEVVGSLRHDRPIVLEDWAGPYRQQFEAELHAIVGRLERVRAELDDALALVARQVRAAQDEQDRRVAARAEATATAGWSAVRA